MTFDYSKGYEPRYMVSLYGETLEDHYYSRTYTEAKEIFKRLQEKPWVKAGTIISLYDMTHDIRKEFYRKEKED